jgi:cytochrome c553
LPPEASHTDWTYTPSGAQAATATWDRASKAPTLRRLTPAALQQKVLDYRSGKTLGEQTAIMARAVAGLSDAEIAAVSIYARE